MMFLFVIMGATHGKAPAGFAPIAIGLCLTLIHLISIPVTNTSVNPARSTGPALFVGGWALAQLWLFWLAPLLGGAAGRRALPLAQRRTLGAGDRHLTKSPRALTNYVVFQGEHGGKSGTAANQSCWVNEELLDELRIRCSSVCGPAGCERRARSVINTSPKR